MYINFYTELSFKINIILIPEGPDADVKALNELSSSKI